MLTVASMGLTKGGEETLNTGTSPEPPRTSKKPTAPSVLLR